MKPLTRFTAALCLAVSVAWAAESGPVQPLAVFTVKTAGAQVGGSVDGQVEAVREATLSAQVQGAVISVSGTNIPPYGPKCPCSSGSVARSIIGWAG